MGVYCRCGGLPRLEGRRESQERHTTRFLEIPKGEAKVDHQFSGRERMFSDRKNQDGQLEGPEDCPEGPNPEVQDRAGPQLLVLPFGRSPAQPTVDVISHQAGAGLRNIGPPHRFDQQPVSGSPPGEVILAWVRNDLCQR